MAAGRFRLKRLHCRHSGWRAFARPSRGSALLLPPVRFLIAGLFGYPCPRLAPHRALTTPPVP